MEGVNWVQLFVESVMMVGAFLVMYWKQRIAAEHRFTKLETLVTGLSSDHDKLEGKIENLDNSVQQLHMRISKVRDRIAPAA